MKLNGKYLNCGRTLDGEMTVTFVIDGSFETVQELDAFAESELDIEIDKHSEKRSLNANAYLWKLCDLIARRINSDKDTIYLLMLRHYGLFQDVEVISEAADTIRGLFRTTEDLYTTTATRVDNDGTDTEVEMIGLRCYIGSHTYNKKQMAHLLNGCVDYAKDLGISLISDEEIKYLINNWRAKNEKN